jgi:FkbM family methyltransferase
MLNRLIALAIGSAWIRRLLLLVRFRELADFWLRRWPLLRPVPGGPQLRYRVNALDNLLVAREVFAQGEYDRLRELPDIESFVDLGCNCGYFPLLLATFVPQQRLRGLCIDANPRMVEDTRWHLQANALHQVHAVWGLVGAAGAGERSNFFVNPSAAGSSQFEVTPTGHLSKQPLKRIEVPVLDLESLWIERFGDTACDVLKIDIEGSEGHFLERELRFVARCRCVVIEIHGWVVQPADIRRRMEGAGMRLADVICNEQDAEVHLYRRDMAAAA